jgi:phosphocarrier protein HPr
MLERRVTVINDLGLHARAAAQVVKTSRLFHSRITLTHSVSGVSANAKSILSLLYLAASKGVTVIIVTDGDDEAAAIDAVEKLFLEGFGEL